MRHTVLGLACLTFICLTHGNGSAHELAGRGFAEQTAFARGAALAAPAAAEICKVAVHCATESAPEAEPEQRREPVWLTPSPVIAAAIATASAATGVDADYLLRTAALESSLDPFKEVKTSSATGLYQFVEHTWLYMMREIGAEFGLGDLTGAIAAGEGGRFEVSDPEARAQILWLRYDPALAAMFAADFTRRNAEFLTQALGRAPDSGELYLAHVLGQGGAAQLIRLIAENPGADACKLFKRAARANRTIFYDGRRARTVEEVYGVLTNKYFDIPVHAEERVPWMPAPVELPYEAELIHTMG
jgi:hypothetical protein